jgi:hypothetical protein
MDNIAVDDVAANEVDAEVHEAPEAVSNQAAEYAQLFDEVEKQLDELSGLSSGLGHCRSDQERVEVLCKYVLSSQSYVENVYKLLVEMNNLLVDKIGADN